MHFGIIGCRNVGNYVEVIGPANLRGGTVASDAQELASSTNWHKDVYALKFIRVGRCGQASAPAQPLQAMHPKSTVDSS